MYYKNKKIKECALLDSSAEVSLIHTRVYNSLKEKPKLKTQSVFFQWYKVNQLM